MSRLLPVGPRPRPKRPGRRPGYTEIAVRVDFLYWEGCPSHEEALERLRTVLREERVAAAIAVTRVETEEDARALRFPGSPTIRIDGQDIQPPEHAADGRLTCRLYVLEDGRPSPLPSSAMIRRAVRAAAAAESPAPPGANP